MTEKEIAILVFGGSILYDFSFEEPGEKWHPVVWIGSLVEGIKVAGGRFQTSKFYGFLLLALSVGTVSTLSYHTVTVCFYYSKVAGILVGIFLLKATISARCLFKEVQKAKKQIHSTPELARRSLKSLVGRDTRDLTKAHLRSAAVESLFENLSDGLISPLFFYCVGLNWGLGGGMAAAMGYKVVNTIDSMIGYKTPEYKDCGLAGARMDDILNFLPARLTAVLIVLAGLSKNSLRIAFRDSRLTQSPNAGWPISAASGLLMIKLIKPGEYTVGQEYDLPEKSDIDRAIRKSKSVLFMIVLICPGTIWILF